MTLLSPGVESKETNTQSTIVQNATGRAAIVGKFQWGPAFQVTQITNEVELADLFGQPDNETADYFISAANFLQYGNDLRVVRAVNDEFAKNASPIFDHVNYTINTPGSNYKINDTIRVKYQQVVVEEAGKITKVDTDGKILSIFIPTEKIIKYAKTINQYPALSDAWSIEVVTTGSGVGGVIAIDGLVSDAGIVLADADTASEIIAGTAFQASLVKYGQPGIVALYPGEIGSQLEVEIVSKAKYEEGTINLPIYPYGGTRVSSAKAVFGYGPQTENQYAFIVRRNGVVVESFVLSTQRGEKDVYGNNIFMDDFFSKGASRFVFASSFNWPKNFSGIIRLGGGVSANDQVTAGDLMQAWDHFADREALHVNLMIAGACAGESDEVSSVVQKHAVSIAEERQDCVVFISPPKSALVNVKVVPAVQNLTEWRTGTGEFDTNNMNISSTYAFIDGNYKYQYDKFNDVNRWVPLAADIAGLCARTDQIAQPWMSPAGYNRGQIMNVIKLAIEPRQAQRDALYQEAINPVVGFQGGDGFVLFGDKTATNVPTPFDRLNVRRLFNMLKKNIGDSSKYRLFENNDAFTRNSFRMETSQYIAGIKALGGVYDFRVVCDATNNTPAVIDRNEFVGTMYVKPSRSINYITLNFVSTATGADFDELIGTQQQ